VLRCVCVLSKKEDASLSLPSGGTRNLKKEREINTFSLGNCRFVSYWLKTVGQNQPKVGEKIRRNLRAEREINFLRQKIPSQREKKFWKKTLRECLFDLENIFSRDFAGLDLSIMVTRFGAFSPFRHFLDLR